MKKNDELQEKIAELEKENDELKSRVREAEGHCFAVNTENNNLRNEMNKIKEASRLLQSDFLLYIQLNGELARENQRLQEKLKEYETEAQS